MGDSGGDSDGDKPVMPDDEDGDKPIMSDPEEHASSSGESEDEGAEAADADATVGGGASTPESADDTEDQPASNAAPTTIGQPRSAPTTTTSSSSSLPASAPPKPTIDTAARKPNVAAPRPMAPAPAPITRSASSSSLMGVRPTTTTTTGGRVPAATLRPGISTANVTNLNATIRRPLNATSNKLGTGVLSRTVSSAAITSSRPGLTSSGPRGLSTSTTVARPAASSATATATGLCRDHDHANLIVEKKNLTTKMEEMEKALQVTKEAVQSKESELQKVTTEKQGLEDQLSTLNDRMELVTVDKELAEQQVEELSAELTALKEKIATTKPDAVVMSLRTENGKLKEAIVRLRDFSIRDQQEKATQIEQLKAEIIRLEDDCLQLHTYIETQDKTIEQMTETLEGYAGCQEAFEKLTESDLAKSDTIKELNSQIKQLDDLRVVSEELEKEQEILEKKLRETLYGTEKNLLIASGQVHMLKAKLELQDRNISQYKDLVRAQTLRLKELEQGKADDHNVQKQLDSTQQELLSMTLALQNKDFKATERELRDATLRLASRQALQLSEFFQSFIPEFYMNPADIDGFYTYQFVDRVVEKCIIVGGCLQKMLQERSDDSSQLVAVRWKALDVFERLKCCTSQLRFGIERCRVEAYLVIGHSIHDTKGLEAPVDEFIEMLKKDSWSASYSFHSIARTCQVIETIVNDTVHAATISAPPPALEVLWMIEHVYCICNFVIFKAKQTSEKIFPESDFIAIAEHLRQYELSAKQFPVAFSTEAIALFEPLITICRELVKAAESLEEAVSVDEYSADAVIAIKETFHIFLEKLKVSITVFQTHQSEIEIAQAVIPPWKHRAGQIKSKLKDLSSLRDDYNHQNVTLNQLTVSVKSLEYQLAEEKRQKEALYATLKTYKENDIAMKEDFESKIAEREEVITNLNQKLEFLQSELERKLSSQTSPPVPSNSPVIAPATPIRATSPTPFTTPARSAVQSTPQRGTQLPRAVAIKPLLFEITSLKAGLKYIANENTKLKSVCMTNTLLGLPPLQISKSAPDQGFRELSKLTQRLRTVQACSRIVNLAKRPEPPTQEVSDLNNAIKVATKDVLEQAQQGTRDYGTLNPFLKFKSSPCKAVLRIPTPHAGPRTSICTATSVHSLADIHCSLVAP
ncbi:dynactin 150 kDa subunit [Pelomyxa schiedti]|nr:dynactin 150 kDa subunit [Pelomyxa schiedti]